MHLFTETKNEIRTKIHKSPDLFLSHFLILILYFHELIYMLGK